MITEKDVNRVFNAAQKTFGEQNVFRSLEEAQNAPKGVNEFESILKTLEDDDRLIPNGRTPDTWLSIKNLSAMLHIADQRFLRVFHAEAMRATFRNRGGAVTVGDVVESLRAKAVAA